MKIETYYKILEYLKSVIQGREFEGHVYSVGGCERDKHLGLKEIKDIDLVVDLPNNSGIRFANWLYSIGLTISKPVVYENFGTAMFKLSAFPDEEIEVVHTRKEIYRDKNSRNPETDYGTINEDCFRRDFTINALYHNISTNEDFDLTGLGLIDLEQGIIRTCNEPNITMNDDSLRIMRAIRFSSKLGFKINEDTLKGIVNNVKRLEIISKERITDEFNKILLSAHPAWGLMLLAQYGILEVIMPDYKVRGKYSDVLYRISKLKETDYYTLETALGMFFVNGLVDTNIKDYILRDFKYSNDIIKEVSLYADNARGVEYACAMKFAAKIRELAKVCGDKEHFNKLVAVAKANEVNGGKDYFKFLDEVSDIDMMFGYKLPVDGNDIMDVLEIGPCKEIKVILDKLMEKAYENPKITRSECMKLIIEYGKEIKDNE